MTSLFLALPLIPITATSNKFLEPEREIKEMNDTVRAARGGTYVKLSGGVTHYDLAGPADGDVVVLIHGASLSMWVWDRQVEALVNAGFRVLRYDHFGRGMSDYPRTVYDRELYRAQLAELLDTLGIDGPVGFVGHSYGGIVASYFTSRHPERVNRIVYVAPGVKLGRTAKAIMTSGIGKRIIHMNLENLPKNIDSILNSLKIPITPYKEMYLEQICNKGFEASAGSLFSDALGDYRPFYAEAGKQNRKVMLLWGDKDRIAAYRQMKMVLKAIPQTDFRILEGSGHVPQFDAADRFNNILIGFLKQ